VDGGTVADRALQREALGGLARALQSPGGMSEMPSPWLLLGMLAGSALAGLFYAWQYGILG
jgi:hypothetical protein